MARARGTWGWRSERGAVLVHVAIAIIGLTAFAALTIDYGILWMSRRQAQNAADAAALSGAISMAFDEPGNKDLARAAAEAAGEANTIFGQAPNIDRGSGNTDADIIIGPCPPNSPGLPDTCVRANVYRNQQKDPLPTFFARLLGLSDQGVKATATAQVATGRAVRCMRPWAVPDRWNDVLDDNIDDSTCLPGESDAATWCWNDTYDAYDKKGVPLPAPRDTYDEATDGFNYDDYSGLRVQLKVGDPHQQFTSGWFLPVALPRESEPPTGGSDYRENIWNCNSLQVNIGDQILTEPGGMIGPTRQGLDLLIAQDPSAEWTDGVGVTNSCTEDGNGPCYCPNVDGDALEPCNLTGLSPRVVPIPVFDIDEYYTSYDKTSGRFNLRITRIMGFFVEEMQGQDIFGRLTFYPSEPGVGGGNDDPSSFLRTVILIR